MSKIKEWTEAEFEKFWNEMKNKPRGFAIRHTRKYVAQLFFYGGIKAALELEESIGARGGKTN